MADTCIFCRIVAGELPSTVVYENDLVLAIRDINPVAPVHVLVLTKEHYDDIVDLGERSSEASAALLEAVASVAQIEQVAQSGFRTTFNTGVQGGQTVAHVHAHVIGRRQLSASLG